MFQCPGQAPAECRPDPHEEARRSPRGDGVTMSFSWSHPQLSLTPVVIALGLLAWYFEAIRHCDPPATRRQKTAFCCGTIALLIAASWPLAELARTTSLLTLVFQRQLLIL